MPAWAINVAIGIVAAVAAVALSVYGILSRPGKRRRWGAARPRSLTRDELAGLRRWQKRNLILFVVVMALLVLTLGLLAIFSPSETAWLAVTLGFAAGAVVGLAHTFSARCPSCGRHLAFENNLVLLRCCAVCGAVLKEGPGGPG